MDIVPVVVSLLLLGFSKGRNQLKLKGFFFTNRMQKKDRKLQKCSLQNIGFVYHGEMLSTHTARACAGKGKVRPVGD